MSTQNNDLSSSTSKIITPEMLVCDVHQSLKKFYITKENRFICEYDGYFGESDSILTLNQFLEINKNKLHYLIQGSSGSNLSQRAKDLMPAIREILYKVNKESNDIIKICENYTNCIVSRSTSSQGNTENLQDLLREIPTDAEGRPDFRRLTFNAQRERSLTNLAHILARTEEVNFIPSGKNLTENLVSNCESIQLEAIDLLSYLLDLIDLSYDNLIEEVAKCENKIIDKRYRYLLRTNFIPRKQHEEMILRLKTENEGNLTAQYNFRIKEFEGIIFNLNSENQELKNQTLRQTEWNRQKEQYEIQMENLKRNYENQIKNSGAEKDRIIWELQTQLEELKKNNINLNNLHLNSKEGNKQLISEYETEILKLRANHQDLLSQIEDLSKFNTSTSSNFQQMKESYVKRIHELEIEIIALKKEKDFEVGQLNEKVKILNGKYSDEIKNLEMELGNIRKINLDLKNDKTKDNLLLQVKQLQGQINILNNELEEANERNKLEEGKYSKNKDNEVSRIKSFYDNIIEEGKINIGKEKEIAKRLMSEKDQLNYKMSELVIHNTKLQDELKGINISHERTLNNLKLELNDTNLTREKILFELQEQRERYDLLSNDNSKLRNIKNELEILVLELKEKLDKYKSEEDRKFYYNNQQVTEFNNHKLSYEKKIALLEEQLREMNNRFEIKNSGFNNQIQEFIREQAEFSKIRNGLKERIDELEREVLDLRDQLKEKDSEKDQLSLQINSFKTIIERLKENHYENIHTRQKENIKLTEASGNSNDVNKIKEILLKKISVLEKDLENEKNNLNTYTANYEGKLLENHEIITDLAQEKETLIHQIQLITAELEKERSHNSHKIQELNDQIRDFSRTRDRLNGDWNEERNKYNQRIHFLEKELNELRFNIDTKHEVTVDDSRVHELEVLLLDERTKYKILYEENLRLNGEIREVMKNGESNRIRIIEIESEINDEKNKCKQIKFDYEVLSGQIGDKDSTIEHLIEEIKQNKINSETQILNLTSQNKEFARKIEQLQIQLEEMGGLTSSENPGDNMQIIQELNDQVIELNGIKEFLEKDNENIHLKFKSYEEENGLLKHQIKDLKHINEEMRIQWDEMKNYHEFYTDLKLKYDDVLQENEISKSKYNDFDSELEKERERFSHLADNNTSKMNELYKQIDNLKDLISSYERQIAEKNKRISELEAESELAKTKLDMQYNEIQILKKNHDNFADYGYQNQDLLAQLEEARRYKERIEEELNEKKRRVTDLSYENDNLKTKIREDRIIIDNLKKKLGLAVESNTQIRSPEPRKSRAVNQFYEEMKNSIYYNIDFSQVDFDGLLVNRSNWEFFSNWLSPLRAENAQTGIKLNLLYKATRDGFNSTKFKERSKRIYPTLVVMQTNYEKVIGGYTPLKWDNPKLDNHEYAADNTGKTFLFSVTLGKKFKLLQNDFAICNSNTMGPIFGAGSDLEIVNNSDKNYNNFAGIGKSFDYKGDPDLFYGGEKYTVKDYEVYEVVL